MKAGTTKASPEVYLYFYASDTSDTITCASGAGCGGSSSAVPAYRKWPFAWETLTAAWSAWKL